MKLPAPADMTDIKSRHRFYRWVGVSLIGVALALSAMLGLTARLDRALMDWRFAFSANPASGELVFLDIDGATLDSVAVWPWPRSEYAEVIDRLLELGAYEIWLDIDFSTTSTGKEDGALATALERAGGYVHLAAFERNERDGGVITRPHPSFSEFANAFLVNAVTDESGIVRAVPAYARVGNGIIPSLAMATAGVLPSARRGGRTGLGCGQLTYCCFEQVHQHECF